MKIYDKEMFKTQQELGTVILIIVVFLVGFFVGYITNSYAHSRNKNAENQHANEQQLDVQV